MSRTLCCSIFGLCALLLFGNFQCEGNFESPIDFLLRDWRPALLDNSGAQPVLAENAIPRKAFGLRLSARMTSDGTDSLVVTQEQGFYLSPLHPIHSIQLFATDAFDNVAAGEEISTRFRVRTVSGSSLDYLALDQAQAVYNFPGNSEAGYHLDLLMTEPPAQAGNYQFSVKINFEAMTTPLNRDTMFNLPTAILQ
jgi:hypothetical protein